MKALVQDIYGTSDVLRLEEVDRPEPAAGEVLVRIAAASVNAADWHIMRGEPRIARLMDRSIFGRKGPRERIRGRDFAGIIEAVGPGVTGWQVGDKVLGEDDATLAEYAAVPQACLARKPEALSFEDAAALPLAAVTADLCLTRGGVAGRAPGAGHRRVGRRGHVRRTARRRPRRHRHRRLQHPQPRPGDVARRRRRSSTTPARTSPASGVVRRRARPGRQPEAARPAPRRRPGRQAGAVGRRQPGRGHVPRPGRADGQGRALRPPPRPARADPAGHAGCGAAHRARRNGHARRNPPRDRPHLPARRRRRRRSGTSRWNTPAARSSSRSEGSLFR